MSHFTDTLDTSPEQLREVIVQTFRCRFVDYISDLLATYNVHTRDQQLPVDSQLAKDMRAWLQANTLGKREVDQGQVVARIEGLLADLSGQVTEAVSKESYFTRWGLHYLLSLQRAHAMQQCNNFKVSDAVCVCHCLAIPSSLLST